MKEIDLNDYRKSGEGANGSSYDCISDPLEMVKLYNTDYPKDTIYQELDVARKVFSLGVPSPEPGELVTDGERLGIRFRRIVGKRSYSRMLSDEPERVEELSREFARYCKLVHSTECPEGVFPDAKPQFLHLLETDRAFNDSEKQTIADFINSIPDSTTALHGDMHIGNVISTLPKGAPLSVPHKIYFIDLGYFSRGFPLLDLGMTRNICMTSAEDFRVHDFHVTGELTRRVWEYFVDEYFFAEDRLAERYFGKGQTFESVSEAIRPYECCKLLLVEFNLGVMLPHYERHIRETFGF